MLHRPHYPWNLKALLSGKPTVGWLMDLCEENYIYLTRLAPEVRHMQGHYLSHLEGATDLYLEVLEQTPYTSLLHLTYYFTHESGQAPDPDATIRVYHDSRQAEVLNLQQHILPLNQGVTRPTLEQKWRISLFLSKWLAYSVRQGHCFLPEQAVTGPGRKHLLPV
ncbi:DUF1249 domain-containing protein [Sedimenticola thiotaurini]|uniref:DUF1249 domain-containing protein n=1 Tax=Sedimenticola thiotaurini TaxID=1543721 RepID=UPI001F18A202|nr:DUF1249 domain-containing protein [Sedimenticola thiotaurini]